MDRAGLAASPTGVCSICLEEAPLVSWSSAAGGCGHAYCLACISRHVQAELDIPGADRLRCAFRGEPADCTAPPDVETLEAVIRLGVLGPGACARARERAAAARRNDALNAAQRAGHASSRALALCPNLNCVRVLEVSASTASLGSRTSCPSCSVSVCMHCAAPWGGDPTRQLPSHEGMTCAAVVAAAAAAASSSVPAHVTLEATAAALGALAASVKTCPGCGAGVSHYRGHACHHIAPGRGCPECVRSGRVPAAHWCYCCRGPWPCSAGCPSFCDPACDCTDCPDCAPGSPCVHCSGPNGSCRSCAGSAGDPMRDAAWAETQRAARAARQARGWVGPSSLRSTAFQPAALPLMVELPAEDQRVVGEMHSWAARLLAIRSCALAAQQRADVLALATELTGGRGGQWAAPAQRARVLDSWALLRAQLDEMWRDGPLRTLYGGAGTFRFSAALNQCNNPRDAVTILHAVARDVAAGPHAAGGGGVRDVRAVLLRRGGTAAIVEYVFRMHGGSSADEEALVALAEGVLELFELLCKTPDDVAALAGQGAFGVLYRMLARHGEGGDAAVRQRRPGQGQVLPPPATGPPRQRMHAGVLHRTLRVLETAGRVATAAGRDIPPAAEAAFDRAGGTALLVRLVGDFAMQRDAVLLPLALRALAALRLHTVGRITAARPVLGILVRLLLGCPSPQAPILREGGEFVPRHVMPLSTTRAFADAPPLVVSAASRQFQLVSVPSSRALTTLLQPTNSARAAGRVAGSFRMTSPRTQTLALDQGSHASGVDLGSDVMSLPAANLAAAAARAHTEEAINPMAAASQASQAPPHVSLVIESLQVAAAAAGPPVQLSTPAAAAAVVALARLVTALQSGAARGLRWSSADTEVVASAIAAAPSSRQTGNDMWGLGRAMCSLAETRRDPLLPLWEGVVLAGALLALRKATGPVASALTPWRVSPSLREVVWNRLPSPPYALAELARVMRFRPGTLRAHLAAGTILVAQVADLEAAVAVPVWQLVLVAPIALVVGLWHALRWLLTTGLRHVVGATILVAGVSAEAVALLPEAMVVGALWPVWKYTVVLPALFMWRWMVYPVAVGAYWAAYYAVAAPLWWTGFYLGKGLHWAASALGTAFYSAVARPVWWFGFYLAAAASAAGRALYWTIYYSVGWPIWWAAFFVGKGLSTIGTGIYWAIYYAIGWPLYWAAFYIGKCLPYVGRGLYWAFYYAIGWPIWWAAFFVGKGLRAIGTGIYWAIYYAIGWPLYWAAFYIGKCLPYVGRGLYWAFYYAIGWPIWWAGHFIGKTLHFIGTSVYFAASWCLYAMYWAVYYVIFFPLYWAFYGVGWALHYAVVATWALVVLAAGPVYRAVMFVVRPVSWAVWTVLVGVGQLIGAAGRAVGSVVRAVAMAVFTVVRAITGLVMASLRVAAGAVRATSRAAAAAVRAALGNRR